jgi:hypothetical protein
MSLLSKAIKDVVNAGEDALDQAQDTADQVTDAAKAVAEAFADAGMRFVDAVEDFADDVEKILDFNSIGIRSLRPHEKQILRRVYESSLPPLDRILIVSQYGIGGRAFCIPASLLAALGGHVLWATQLMLIEMVFRAAKPGEYYLLFMGRNAYNNSAVFGNYDVLPGDTLVHETAHVWQGFNRAFTWAYIFDSVYNQTAGGAYGYNAGQQWNTYGAEQQAKIVEDWFAAGESTTDTLYAYIRSNVRPARPNGTTDFSFATGSPATSGPAARPAPPTVVKPPVRPGLKLK